MQKMATQEEYKIDKTNWIPGPWKNEPDRVEFEHDGFPCLMLRQSTHGAWCGYVAVPPGHPWHGKDYNDIDASVHGGLTYAEKCAGLVCHVPKPGEPDDVWWLGFDCVHSGDFSPGYADIRASHPGIFSPHPTIYEQYRDVDYVRSECRDLAKQARNATTGG
jgi:hypothetical protein